MKKHKTGKGNYGFSYEIEINEKGKVEKHRFTFNFEHVEQREVAMRGARSIPGAKNIRRV